MALELDRVREIADRVATSSGLEVVDVEFRGSGNARMLRVFLDKPGAAGGDPLAGVTQVAEFARFVGSRVKLTTRNPVNNNRYFEGRLESFSEGLLTLDLSVASHKSRRKMGAAADQGQKIGIEFANVEKANLVPEI